MDIHIFWDIVDSSKEKLEGKVTNESTAQIHMENMTNKLSNFSEEEILNFAEIYIKLKGQVFRESLDDVLHIIHGMGTEDDFDWFLSWVVFQGKEIYNAVVENPDNLADYLDKDYADVIIEEYDRTVDIGYQKYREKRGEEILTDTLPPRLMFPIELFESPSNIGRQYLMTDKELINKFSKSYPKLWEKFGDSYFS